MRWLMLSGLLLSVNVMASDCVILLHGLARTSHSMAKMENALASAGYHTVNLSYPSRHHSIEILAQEAIDTGLERCPADSAIHFVTHSLGGILVRQYLQQNEVANLGRVVMLAPPNNGSEVVDKLSRVPGFKLANGEAGMQLGTGAESVPKELGAVGFDLGVIAGTRTVNPILSLYLPNPDDGKVSVASTRVAGMRDHIQLPVTHTFMMRNRRVIAQTIHYLQRGRFFH